MPRGGRVVGAPVHWNRRLHYNTLYYTRALYYYIMVLARYIPHHRGDGMSGALMTSFLKSLTRYYIILYTYLHNIIYYYNIII